MERLTRTAAKFDYCRDFCAAKCAYTEGQIREKCLDAKLYEKLRDYEDAEAEGRLLVLPCKVGDAVYWNTGLDIVKARVADFIIDGAMQLRLNLPTLDITPVYPHDRLYLTREEAEAALRKEGRQ